MITVKGIEKSYNHKHILRGVDLSISKGEIVALLGPNGSGKTTCFYAIVGLVSPDKGSVYLDKTDITRLPICERAKLGIGYLPQESSIFRGLTVEQNIMIVLELVEKDHKRRTQKLEALLGKFSITHLKNEQAIRLSGGERRRLEIARALAMNPKFIFLDEPLAGIDPIAINGMRLIIQQLKNDGIGVVITDHNARDTISIADRVYILDKGKIVLSGDVQDVVNNKKAREIYLGEHFSMDGHVKPKKSAKKKRTAK
jgi:lipopolysaccharide export system ATP-binding protein